MFSSKTDQWGTPQNFFDKLNDEFHFTLDPCADEFNHKCDTYFTEEQDGLIQNWEDIQYFTILHMEQLLRIGLRSVQMKVERII